MKLSNYMAAMKMFAVSICLLFAFCFSIIARADGSVLDLPLDVFFGQVFDLVKSFGGMTWTLKVAGVLALLVSSMKVSALKPIWDKLGKAQVWFAPILSLAYGVVSMGNVTVQGLLAYVFAGAGAVVLHELLDSLKAAPGVKTVFGWIELAVKTILGGKSADVIPLKK